MGLAAAPGKVILAGEHAVVHGMPALVTAVDRVVRVWAEPSEGSDPRPELDARHERYLAGKIDVATVVESPEELLGYAVALATDGAAACLRIESELPMGSGMGSSAAICLAAMLAANPDLDRSRLATFAARTENLQHGRSSGIDPHVCLHGGAWRFQRGQDPVRVAPPRGPLHLVQTGRPASTTGECVARVAERFGSADPIWRTFGEVVDAIKTGTDRRGAVLANQELLERIGVVPEPVAQFCAALAEEGLAAKICGAGAVRGDAGGIVWVVGGAPPPDLVARHGYENLMVEATDNGARSIDG